MKHKRDFKALEQRRLKAARLLKQDLSQARVPRRLEVSRESVSRWAEQFEADGQDALRRKRLGRPPQLDLDQRRALGQALVQGAIANGLCDRAMDAAAGAQAHRAASPAPFAPPSCWSF
jgi:transposase